MEDVKKKEQREKEREKKKDPKNIFNFISLCL